MSQLYCTGRVMSDLELKTSARGVPYLCFPIAERVGYGKSAHTQYISVWAWGTVARQLVSDGVGKGSVLWVSGSLELEEYTKKDGVTHDKRLKLKLKDWGFPLPAKSHGMTSQRTPRSQRSLTGSGKPCRSRPPAQLKEALCLAGADSGLLCAPPQ